MSKRNITQTQVDLNDIAQNMRDVFGKPIKKETIRVGREDWQISRWSFLHGAAVLYRSGKNGSCTEELRIERYGLSEDSTMVPKRDETFHCTVKNNLAFEIMCYPGKETDNKPRNILFRKETEDYKRDFLINKKVLVGGRSYFKKVKCELTSGQHDNTLVTHFSRSPRARIK